MFLSPPPPPLSNICSVISISIWNGFVIPTYFDICTDNQYDINIWISMCSFRCLPDLACTRQEKNSWVVNLNRGKIPALSKPDLHLIKCLFYFSPFCCCFFSPFFSLLSLAVLTLWSWHTPLLDYFYSVLATWRVRFQIVHVSKQ